MQAVGEEKAEAHPITAPEYAKVHAILQRIAGLRRAMVATALVGVAVSFLVFTFTFVFGLLQVLVQPTTPFPLSQALEYAIMAFVPFIATMGYFSYRVNKHIDRLSKGKYEPPIIIE